VLSPNDAAVNNQIEIVKKEWKMLWLSRIDDKVRAEGIAKSEFSSLSIERGTVIAASRDCKTPDLRDILQSLKVPDVDRVAGYYPAIGGSRKFARTVLNKQPRIRRNEECVENKKGCKALQVKQGGRGWLHRC
jgi:hypothetical protein